MTLIERVKAVLPDMPDYNDLRHDLTFPGPVAVTSDFHIPLMRPDMLVDLCEAALRHDIKDLLIMGDLTNQDEAAHWTPNIAKHTHTLQAEFDAVHDVFRILFDYFRNVYWYPGNHDKRLIKAMEAALGMAEIARLVWPEGGMYPGGVGEFVDKDRKTKRLIVSDLPSVYATIQGHRWYFTHPKSYSVLQLKVARELAAKLHCNVGVGHTHSFAQGFDKSGKYYTLDLGGLFDPAKFAYVAEQDTTAPAMTGGFWVMEQGRVIGYSARK